MSLDNTDIYTIDPSNGFATVKLPGATSFGAAANARSPLDGKIYYFGYTQPVQLGTYDPTTNTDGTAVTVTGISAADLANDGLIVRSTFSADGTLFAGADQTATIYRITTAGVATAIPISGTFSAGTGDMAFDPTVAAGNVFYTTSGPIGGPFNLYKVTLNTTPANATSATSVLVGALGLATNVTIYGIAYGDNGILYGTDAGTGATAGTNVYTISKTTGAATLVGAETPGVAGGVYDLASLPGHSADLSIVKTHSTNPVYPGAAINYSLTIGSAATSTCTLSAVTVNDTLPTSVALTNVTYTPPTGGTYNATTHELTGITLAPGTTLVLGVSGTVPANATGSFTNSAVISPPTGFTLPDPLTSNNTSSDVATITPEAGLTITKTAPSTASTGALIAYSVVIANSGPSAANGTAFSDTVPANLTIKGTPTCAPSGTGASCGTVTVNGQAVTSTIAALPAGTSVTFTIYTTTTTAATYTNTGSLTAPGGTTDSGTATTSSATTVVTATTPGFAKTVQNLSQTGSTAVTSDTAKPGDVLQYSLSFTNTTNVPVSGLTVSDFTPGNTTYVAASATCVSIPTTTPATTCTAAATSSPIAGNANRVAVSYAFGGPALAPGATVTATFNVVVN